MHPHALARLQKAKEANTARFVEVSADDVLDAAKDISPADDVARRLTGACEGALRGRPIPRTGEPVPRTICLARDDLEHLLARVAEAEALAQEKAKAESVPQPSPESTPEPDEEDHG